jgi:signal peptidase I
VDLAEQWPAATISAPDRSTDIRAAPWRLFLAAVRRQLAVIKVEGESMAPTLNHGDRVFVRTTKLDRVRPGDIVVVSPSLGDRPPDVPLRYGPHLIIKRVLAVPGDPIPRHPAPLFGDLPDPVVPAGRLLLLGDNPAASQDSRQLGYFRGDGWLGAFIRRLDSKR